MQSGFQDDGGCTKVIQQSNGKIGNKLQVRPSEKMRGPEAKPELRYVGKWQHVDGINLRQNDVWICNGRQRRHVHGKCIDLFGGSRAYLIFV
jgi:hypothetical protein